MSSAICQPVDLNSSGISILQYFEYERNAQSLDLCIIEGTYTSNYSIVAQPSVVHQGVECKCILISYKQLVAKDQAQKK